MSYKWGINGNDINWDEMQFLNYFMPEFEYAVFNGEAPTNEDGEIEDGYYDSFSDSNPDYIYYGGEYIDIQEILKKGEKIEEHKEWFIVHHTNSNFITLIGNVPDKYLTEEYIKERDESQVG